MRNHLKHETSPYLLQHAENPVDWYPWGEEAFHKARQEDKPIFLSIGYSTCHWCHVMAHESFEDQEIAGILNQFFVSIKVDKEERPDIDSVYMAVCQAFTGSGGWPTSIFMTADQKPFFAGTYFPKTARGGMPGFRELLLAIGRQWVSDRQELLRSAEEIAALFRQDQPGPLPAPGDHTLPEQALQWYRRNFDGPFGGFGRAPKFPAPHNLLFLMQQYEKNRDAQALEMAEVTLRRMYAGGMFDHIGYGFCRYSTDRRYLVPHFEKMLYDNGLLILAYCKAHELTGNPLYLRIAEKTAAYVRREMTDPEGGFYSAQDADSQGQEGMYYVFTPAELMEVLGERDGAAFCRRFGITEDGNFEGKSIPNLMGATELEDDRFDRLLPLLRSYRHRRAPLHTDDKILTSWNALMIAALCQLYRRSGNRDHLEAAKRAQTFLERRLSRGDTLYVSIREGRLGAPGFLDEYAYDCFALLSLYDATLERCYLNRAAQLSRIAVARYYDPESGGFYLSGRGQEALLFRPKECFDGAVPSGNSMMAYNLVRLHALMPETVPESLLAEQLSYLTGQAEGHPADFSIFLMALSDYTEPPLQVTVVSAGEDLQALPLLLPSGALVNVRTEDSDGYQRYNGETTFYVCQGHCCLPPMSRREFMELLERNR